MINQKINCKLIVELYDPPFKEHDYLVEASSSNFIFVFVQCTQVSVQHENMCYVRFYDKADKPTRLTKT